MDYASSEVLEGLKEFDTATLFNAVIESQGATQGGMELEGQGGVPQNYTGPEIRSLLPELGRAVGYAITAEVTTNDPDSVPIPWDDYYIAMENTPTQMIAVMKDVDSQPGRGASFGDGMAARHKALGVTGAIVDGSVRDLMGIKAVGLPMWGCGLVPGHGVFNLLRINESITAGQLRIKPGELLIADMDGCVKVPEGMDPEVILQKAHEIRDREKEMFDFVNKSGFTMEKMREFQSRQR